MTRCGTCGFTNREGRRFCGECGGSLVQVCQCGFVNEDGERFCGGCGAPANARESSPSAAELRHVVVLFADLTGYTQLSARLDPEETHRLLGRFFHVVDSVVADLGGTIDKHIGDNVMALFGAPIAHGNDPERAGRAAVAMHQRIAELSAELGVPLAVSIGIAGGQVMASGLGSSHHSEYTVIGSSVNLAARLQGQASAGETLIDDSVRQAIAGFADVEALDLLRLKGIDAPVAAWRLHAVRASETASTRPIVGRATELSALREMLAGCTEAGEGAIMVLRGEAGIGKSRLAAEAMHIARSLDMRVHRGACVDFGVSETTLRRVLHEFLSDDWLAAIRETDARVYSAACDLLDIPLERAFRPRYEAIDNKARIEAKISAVAALAVAACRTSPRLLVAEDLHWADPEVMLVMQGLARATETAKLVLLITSRPEATWRLTQPIVELALQGLPAAEGAALATALGVDTATSEAIARRAGGNPLFVEQLAVSANEGRDSDVLPGSVHSVVLARLDRLPAPDRVALHNAAVLGLRFGREALRTMLGDSGYDLAVPLGRGLLVDSAGEIMFQHALVRDAVYTSLTRERRRQLHTRAASLLGAQDTLVRAQHLDFAEDEHAAAAYREAAGSEIAAYRFSHALELLGRACELASGAERFEAEVTRADVLLETGSAQLAVEGYRRAGTHAALAPSSCRAIIGEASAQRMMSRYAETVAALDRAERLTSEDAQRVAIQWHRAAVSFGNADFAGSRRAAEQASTLASRLGDPLWLARAHSSMGDVEFAAGNNAQARNWFSRCVGVCEDAGLTRYALPNRVMLGITYFWRGEFGEARERCMRALASAREIGDRYAAIFAEMFLAIVCERGDDLEAGALHCKRALELANAVQSPRWASEILTVHAIIEDKAGRDGYAFAKQAVDLARAHNVLPYVGPWSLAVQARTARDSEERRACLREGEALMARDTMMINALTFHESAAHAALRMADYDEARRHLDTLQLLMDRHGARFVSVELARLKAQLPA